VGAEEGAKVEGGLFFSRRLGMGLELVLEGG
jgi:hypothetical protein